MKPNTIGAAILPIHQPTAGSQPTGRAAPNAKDTLGRISDPDRLDLDHYLEVLQRKPGALWHSIPLHQAKANGKWPSGYTELFLLLKQRLGETGAAKQMVDVLLLHRIHPAQVVQQAVAGSLAAGAIDGRAVAVLVRTATEGRGPLVVLDVGGLDVTNVRSHRSMPTTSSSRGSFMSKSNAAVDALVKAQTHELRLPTMGIRFGDLADQAALMVFHIATTSPI